MHRPLLRQSATLLIARSMWIIICVATYKYVVYSVQVLHRLVGRIVLRVEVLIGLRDHAIYHGFLLVFYARYVPLRRRTPYYCTLPIFHLVIYTSNGLWKRSRKPMPNWTSNACRTTQRKAPVSLDQQSYQSVAMRMRMRICSVD